MVSGMDTRDVVTKLRHAAEGGYFDDLSLLDLAADRLEALENFRVATVQHVAPKEFPEGSAGPADTKAGRVPVGE